MNEPSSSKMAVLADISRIRNILLVIFTPIVLLPLPLVIGTQVRISDCTSLFAFLFFLFLFFVRFHLVFFTLIYFAHDEEGLGL